MDSSEPEVNRYTEELRQRMDDEEIRSVEDMLTMAHFEGVQFPACKTSVDPFDLEQDDFLPGVQVMLAEEYMKREADSDLHLMF